jgi:hypothetical protein
VLAVKPNYPNRTAFHTLQKSGAQGRCVLFLWQETHEDASGKYGLGVPQAGMEGHGR